jgi:hypothetical protein
MRSLSASGAFASTSGRAAWTDVRAVAAPRRGRSARIEGMRSRRPALVLLVVVIVLSGALSTSNRDRQRTRAPATTTPAPTAPVAETDDAKVTARLPSSKPVRARTGETVVLRVRSDTPDIAKILAVGARAPVGPGLPGYLRFVAPTAGDLPVDLEVAGTTAGVVRVSDPPD